MRIVLEGGLDLVGVSKRGSEMGFCSVPFFCLLSFLRNTL